MTAIIVILCIAFSAQLNAFAHGLIRDIWNNPKTSAFIGLVFLVYYMVSGGL